jgi:hypothetical protein
MVRTISGPLGQAGISIIYCSTFNNDYLLVESTNYERTRDCLKQRFPLLWTEADDSETPQVPLVSNNNVLSSSPAISVTAAPSSNASTSIAGTNGEPEVRNVDAQKLKQLQALPSLALALCRFRVETLENCTNDLLKLLFYPTR